MKVNLDLSLIQSDDTIIVANNRQVLAIKQSLSEQHGSLKMPNIFSYTSWLQNYWQQNNPKRSIRLLSQMELRFFFKEIIQQDPVNHSEAVIDELIKCYHLCKTHFIDISTMSSFSSSPCAQLVEWIYELEKIKLARGCIDSTDLFTIVNPTLEKYEKKGKYYAFGFKKPTPEQDKLFQILDCELIKPISPINTIQALSFIDHEFELQEIAHWAKETSTQNPDYQIGIVIPNLGELQNTIKNIFDQVFASSLIETHRKPYNISLGISLCQYPLIQHLLNIIKLSKQIIDDSIDHKTLIKVITSPFIQGAHKESNNRALSVNRILALGREKSSTNKILSLIKDCPQLSQTITELRQLKFQTKLSLEDWLIVINKLLTTWAFATDRSLTSSEYQLFEKYQNESLILNKLSDFHKKIGFIDAVKTLQTHLNSVVFQAKGGDANIHVLGALEAEGLFFDAAWISNMTSDFLPGTIKTPLFIPSQVCRDYELPNSSFDAIDQNTKVTLQALKDLSKNITFSYAKSTKNREQLPSPFLNFEEFQVKTIKTVMTRKLNHIDDHKAPNIDDYTIKQGIKTLQNQMSCAFKGFVGRLGIDDFDTPHIGMNRQQQGKLIHKVLETFFGEIQTGKELLELSDLALNDLIEKHIDLAILKTPKSNFKLLEKTRLVKLIKKYLALEKQRGDFEVIKTESTSEVDINGLTFSTRLDRMDLLENNEKLIIDYKSGAVAVSKMIGNPIEQAQLPIYAISNTVDGVAFAAINPSDCQFKAITKNKSALPLKPQTKSKMPEWDIQLMEWNSALNSASDDFQDGIAKVLPAKNACEFCNYDLLCRVEKSPNH